MSDRYKGHTPFPWKTIESPTVNDCLIVIGPEKEPVACASNVVLEMHSGWNKLNDADAYLMADAPKLLAEVKRLEAEKAELVEACEGLIVPTECFIQALGATIGKGKDDEVSMLILSTSQRLELARSAIAKAKEGSKLTEAEQIEEAKERR